MAHGVVVMATGAWFDPRDAALERHGNPNVLTRDEGTSRLAQGCSALSAWFRRKMGRRAGAGAGVRAAGAGATGGLNPARGRPAWRAKGRSAASRVPPGRCQMLRLEAKGKPKLAAPPGYNQISARARSSRALITMTKYVFVTGGVVSSLGKGIAAASLAAILESRGLQVTMLKLDPTSTSIRAP